ncbi:uncharacterized protein LOC117112202, partial [Anneissia japonica]|uniref:uncharacterized protein LOC117112202 n=1 Tax=Anneissia japonica TaxID=1529436 RepID=UPI0014259034
MSPLLYNFYIDELNINLNQSNYGYIISDVKINNLSYADDMVIMAPSLSGLQGLIDICEKYAIEHDITYNAKKSVCMLLCPKQRKLTGGKPEVFLCNSELEFVKDFKYLGHIINNELKDVQILCEYRCLS